MLDAVAPVPVLKAPSGACDCHMHIFDARFPIAAKARRREPDASVEDYRKLQRRLGLDRVVVVQPTAYGKDNRCTLDAIAQIGKGARGIAVIDGTVGDAELKKLAEGGIRGVRFRMTGDPELAWELLPTMAARVAAHGWHIQFQMDGRELHTREALLKNLPCELVLEHIGKFLEPVGVDHPGFQALLRLVDGGRCWVKLSGAYMMSKAGPPLYADIGTLAKDLVMRAPERLLWASNWPHPLADKENMPDDAQLLDLLLEWAPNEETRRKILMVNPCLLYRFDMLAS
jgi:D-galactarolactone isomerase